MTDQYFLARLTGRDLNLRAADADREQVAERLRAGHAEGRLDLTEFQERLERCYEAKTFSELTPLVRDLPRPSESPRRRWFSWLRPSTWRAAPVVPALIALLVISAVAGRHVFWLWVPLLFLFWRTGGWRRRRWASASRRPPDDWI